ncbi:MBL fold metallo-hydrolase [Reinekea thalattae]|uniref:Hydrolase n=1 Tax=Reinekea thalattae TaxID=2593301 RepID=A0A5C8Z940_9GAMM|nr:MBL fold metallo-hydrolase [Reinekea thalattae]TXR53884.1 hydrolase [Reinekea thalattae]
MLKILLICIIPLLTLGYLINNQLIAKESDYTPEPSDHFSNGRFHNSQHYSAHSFRKVVEIWWRFFTEKKRDAQPSQELPISAVTPETLAQLSDDKIHIIKLGHSSLLLKVKTEYWLIDPVFSERASPFRFFGPKRFHPTPITLEQLPTISRVLISHNHYDHLDKKTIQFLAKSTHEFFVPLGVEADLESWGIARKNIVPFDWWQQAETAKGSVTFTPTQHFSGRGLGDSNSTLWGSWVIEVGKQRIFFSSDSGYFEGFKQIGERYGPFDITFIETGAYDKDWPSIHMTPEQSVQAHIDVQGKLMVPIHNSTFDLAFHAWYEPLERVISAAESQAVELIAPRFGEVIEIGNIKTPSRWW